MDNNLTRAQEAQQYYYQQMFDRIFPERAVQQHKQERLGYLYTQLAELEAALVTLEESFGHKYDPNQPRVPAGNPDGGQWTSGGVSADDGEGAGSNATRDILKRVDVRDSQGRLWDRVTIFIGGAGDGTSGIVKDSASLNKNVYGTNYYASWTEGDDVNKLIKRIPQGRQINIVSHSWGGETAANVVIANPSRINTLITIDPVTRSKRPDFSQVRDSVRNWVNVYATGRPDNPIGSGFLNGNLIARGAGRWNNDTQGYADITAPAVINHNEFSAGMNEILFNNRTSIQLLNTP